MFLHIWNVAEAFNSLFCHVYVFWKRQSVGFCRVSMVQVASTQTFSGLSRVPLHERLIINGPVTSVRWRLANHSFPSYPWKAGLWPTFTVAHREHRFNKEKTLQIKEFLANIKNTSKKINPCTLQTKKETVKKKYAHCKQNNCTLQTKLPHTVNKTPAHWKQNSSILQTRKKLLKKLHIASKRITRCKQNSRTFQTKAKNWRRLNISILSGCCRLWTLRDLKYFRW